MGHMGAGAQIVLPFPAQTFHCPWPHNGTAPRPPEILHRLLVKIDSNVDRASKLLEIIYQNSNEDFHLNCIFHLKKMKIGVVYYDKEKGFSPILDNLILFRGLVWEMRRCFV